MLGCTTRRPRGTRARRVFYAPAATLLLACAMTLAEPAQTAEVRAFEMVRSGETYRLHSDIALNADFERVRAVLARYERIPQLDPDITEVTMIGANANGSVRMRLAAHQCMLFCIRYRWTQDVRTLPSGDILAVVVPGDGDIRAGWVRYRTVRDGDLTRLIVDADVDASSLPLPTPLVAPWLQARLKDEALETARLVEKAASEASVSSRSDASMLTPAREPRPSPSPSNAVSM